MHVCVGKFGRETYSLHSATRATSKERDIHFYEDMYIIATLAQVVSLVGCPKLVKFVFFLFFGCGTSHQVTGWLQHHNLSQWTTHIP